MTLYQYTQSEEQKEKCGLDQIHRRRATVVRETKGPEALKKNEIFIHYYRQRKYTTSVNHLLPLVNGFIYYFLGIWYYWNANIPVLSFKYRVKREVALYLNPDQLERKRIIRVYTQNK